MPNYTSNLNLKKPLGTEHYNVADQNGNMEIIDQELGEQAQQISDLSGEVIATKKSVSDGKTLVATAITQKGVATATDATFATMAGNIGQIQTESVLSGNAVVGNVLTGKTFYNNNPKSKLTGTMTNNGTINATLSSNAQAYTIPAGYHNGSGKVTASITNLIAANILAGKTVGGIVGTATADATALATDLASGKTAYVNGTKLIGTLNSDKVFLYNRGFDDTSVTGGLRFIAIDNQTQAITAPYTGTTGQWRVWKNTDRIVMETWKTTSGVKAIILQPTNMINLALYESLVIEYIYKSTPTSGIDGTLIAKATPYYSNIAIIRESGYGEILINTDSSVVSVMTLPLNTIDQIAYPTVLTQADNACTHTHLEIFSIYLKKK